MTKKLLSAILALSCVASIGSTVFAEANVTEAGTTDVEVTVTTNVPTLAVTLPTTADITINPYRLKVEAGEEEVTDAIVTPEYEILNESECAVAISATASITAAGETVILSKPVEDDEEDKAVFMYLEATETEGTYLDAYSSDNATQLLLGTKATTKENLVTLAAEEGAAYYKILGSAAPAPETPWATTDTVTATLAFKVTPVAATGEEDDGE